jgi:phospholipid N-methyltransferase
VFLPSRRGRGTVPPHRAREGGHEVIMPHTGTVRPRRKTRNDAAKAGRLVFLREFLRRPGQLGTCFTSTRALSRKMVEGLALERARAVVELGPGPGPVTEQIVARVPRSCWFLAVEQNPELAAVLRQRFPRVRVATDDAANLEALCARDGIGPGELDAVISGIPFLLLAEPAQRRLLGVVARMLKPGGALSQVTYGAEGVMPKARRFRRVLESIFPEVRRHGPVLANVPPAFVYKCRMGA